MKMRYFSLARKASKHSDYKTHQLGAIVVYGNRVRGMGFNKHKTHPKSNTRFNNCHAELSAILNCDSTDLVGCDMYIYREQKNGSLAMARPCPACLSVIQEAGIKRIHYTIPGSYKTELIY